MNLCPTCKKPIEPHHNTIEKGGEVYHFKCKTESRHDIAKRHAVDVPDVETCKRSRGRFDAMKDGDAMPRFPRRKTRPKPASERGKWEWKD